MELMIFAFSTLAVLVALHHVLVGSSADFQSSDLDFADYWSHKLASPEREAIR
ncbi:MAG: hypothetical protein VYD55_06400 [Chloroflexota bacterium]|nr:hypothetical protein [Chloroflexota bacterium]